MIRIHLAQILSNPAYFHGHIDYLKEPCGRADLSFPLGTLDSCDQMNAFLSDTKNRYLDHIHTKLAGIAAWSATRKPHLLVFPEYSVPHHALGMLREIAIEQEMIIVAGTHRVSLTGRAPKTYEELGITPTDAPQGSAFSPVMMPDGTVAVAGKQTRSLLEPDLVLPYTETYTTMASCRGKKFGLAVIPCIDCLDPAILGQAVSNVGRHGLVVVCPARTPTTANFEEMGGPALGKEALLAFLNCSSTGGTTFNLPKEWHPYWQGTVWDDYPLLKGWEAILEWDINPARYFRNRGSTNSAPEGYHPVCFPIVYAREASWIPKFLGMRSRLVDQLTNDNMGIEKAKDIVNMYLVTEATALPDLVRNKIDKVNRRVLPHYHGEIDAVQAGLEFVLVGEDCDSTEQLWADHVDRALEVLGVCLRTLPPEEMAHLSECATALAECKRNLPRAREDRPQEEVVADRTIQEKTRTEESSDHDDYGELLEGFQDRGDAFNKLLAIIDTKSAPLIELSGMIGVGKTAFVKAMHRKKLGDWTFLYVSIDAESTFAAVLAKMADTIGLDLEIDPLARLNRRDFTDIAQIVLEAFYSEPKRILVLDDFHHLLREACRREHKQIRIFLDGASNPHGFQGGRIVLVTSRTLPPRWIPGKGLAKVELGKLEDKHIERLLDQRLRKTGRVKGEHRPKFARALIDFIGGFPLLAVLAVDDALSNKEFPHNHPEIQLPQKEVLRLAERLLERMEIREDDEEMLKRLSVFRKPVNADKLMQQAKHFRRDKIDDFIRRCIVGHDGQFLQMHEAVRIYFYEKLRDAEELLSLHTFAANYYDRLYGSSRHAKRLDPELLVELIYHRTLSGRFDHGESGKVMIVEEAKMAIRSLYRKRFFERALGLYEQLTSFAPDDPEISIFIGRCLYRLKSREEADRILEDTVKLAEAAGRSAWWVYRDWGHLLIGDQSYDNAEKKLEQARTCYPHYISEQREKPWEDARVLTSLARTHWLTEDRKTAEFLFRQSLKVEENHPYTCRHYAAFLVETGNSEFAGRLKKRFAEVESGKTYVEPGEYEMNVDDDI